MNFHPPAPERHAKPLTSFQFISTLARNPLAVWSHEVFEEKLLRFDWMGLPTIVVSDPEAIRYVLVEKNFALDPLRQRILRPILRDGLLTTEGDYWKRTRKAIAPVFSLRHIHSFAPIMQEQAARSTKILEGHVGTVRDVAEDMIMLTYNILEATLFSGDMPGKPEDFADLVAGMLKSMGKVDPMDVLDAPAFIPRFRLMMGRRWQEGTRKLVIEVIDYRRKQLAAGAEAAPRDLLTLLLEADGLSENEIVDNIITFLAAGHETTARSLAWALYLLSQFPDERAWLEQEIDAHDFDSDPMSWGDALPRTRAVFEESMRLYPPVPTLNRTAREPDKIGHIDVPKGAAVLVLPWVLHRHKAHWDKPDTFVPERFMPGKRESIDRYQYLPFSAGPKVCIGASFGMQEGIIALATILRRLRFEFVGKKHPMPVQKITVIPEGGIPMIASLRR
jgi:cytochrome P450